MTSSDFAKDKNFPVAGQRCSHLEEVPDFGMSNSKKLLLTEKVSKTSGFSESPLKKLSIGHPSSHKKKNGLGSASPPKLSNIVTAFESTIIPKSKQKDPKESSKALTSAKPRLQSRELSNRQKTEGRDCSEVDDFNEFTSKKYKQITRTFGSNSRLEEIS